MQKEVCSHERRPGPQLVAAPRVRGLVRGHGRAQLVPDQALRLVGARVLLLDAANTLTIVFIAKGSTRTAARSTSTGDDDPADRSGDLVVSRPHLRVADRDGRVGALGGNDRVHVHGAAPRAMHLLGIGIFAVALRHRSQRRSSSSSIAAVLRAAHAERELRRGGDRADRVASVSFVGIGMMTSVLPLDLTGEGDTARLRRARADARGPASTTRSRCCPSGCSGCRRFSPATYALRGDRSAILDGASIVPSGATSGRW